MSVVKLQRKGSNVSDDDFDPVFFPKEAIQLKTRLINYGRRDPGSVWVVSKIETYVRLASGRYRLDQSTTPQHLSDLIHIERLGENDGSFVRKRSPTFGSLSYSAIWRLYK